MKKVKHGGPIRVGSKSAENVPGDNDKKAHGSHVKLGGVTLKRQPKKK